MKLPQPGTDHIELLEDVVVTHGKNDRGLYTVLRAHATVNNSQYGHSYQLPKQAVLPKGTIFQVGSYRNSRNDMTSYISLLVVASPDLKLLPKSRGGTGLRVSLYPYVSAFNSWKTSDDLQIT